MTRALAVDYAAKGIKNIKDEILNKNYYFVHSYLAITKKKEDTIAYCKYFDVNVPAVLNYKNMMIRMLILILILMLLMPFCKIIYQVKFYTKKMLILKFTPLQWLK